MCFEAFDRTLRDIMKNVDDANNAKPFSGKAVVLGDDFKKFYLLSRKDLGLISFILSYGSVLKCSNYQRT